MVREVIKKITAPSTDADLETSDDVCLASELLSAFSCFSSLRVSTFLVHYARLFVLFSANYFHNWREMLEGEEETSSPPLRHV